MARSLVPSEGLAFAAFDSFTAMGSLTKALGQIASLVSRASLETESANIHRLGRANKIKGSLSHALDGTMREGAHDMRVFGLGTAASMASVEKYARFTAAMLAVYKTMEVELDDCVRAAGEASTTSASAHVWARHGATLRRAERLRADLDDVTDAPGRMRASTPAVQRYVDAIREAGEEDRRTNGGRLIGHVYCRYFADLFGGQMLQWPYEKALNLPAGTPRHYHFDFPEDTPERRAYIESVYACINEAGATLDSHKRDAAVREAFRAFRHNVEVYSEDTKLYADGAAGAINVATGGLMSVPELVSRYLSQSSRARA